MRRKRKVTKLLKLVRIRGSILWWSFITGMEKQKLSIRSRLVRMLKLEKVGRERYGMVVSNTFLKPFRTLLTRASRLKRKRKKTVKIYL